MLIRLAGLTSSRPGRVLVVVAAFFAVAVAFGARAPGLLRGGHDFEDPGSEAAVVREHLERAAGMGAEPGLVAVVTPEPSLDAAAARAEVGRVAAVIGRDP